MMKKINKWLLENKWRVKSNENKSLNLNAEFIARYTDLDGQYIKFLENFDEVISDDEKTWFLCQKEYNNKSDLAFKWNEFEELSIEAAEGDEDWKKDIEQWWDKKLPIIMSVREGYTFFAIDLDSADGQIVKGEEPEFEETEVVANSFLEFMDMVIKGEITI